MRNWGHLGDYNARMPSIVSKLPELSAGAGLLELKNLDNYSAKRQALVGCAKKMLEPLPGLRFPSVRPGNVCGYKDLTIIIEEGFSVTRDELSDLLAIYGVQTRKYFSPAIHQTHAYSHLELRVPLPNTIAASDSVISLPLFNQMTLQQMEGLCSLISFIAANPREAKNLLEL